MRSCVWLAVGVGLCGCPGAPVEGQGSAGSNGDASSSDGSGSMSGAHTMTMGSQSDSDATDGGLTMTTSVDDTSDPTTVTLDGTGTSTDATAGETTSATDPDTTTTLSAGSSESTDTGVCVDANEPNDTEAEAVVLAAIACDASAMVNGVADGTTTPDWFMFHGAYDELACGGGVEDDAYPRVLVTAGGPLTVCAFVSCGGTVECVTGMAAASGDGRAGCCADSDASLSVNCPNGADESTDVFVSVDTTASSCSDYTLQLSF